MYATWKFVFSHIFSFFYRATTDPAEALQGCDYILHTVPVQYTRVTLLAYQQWIGDIPIISASKGIESESLMYMSQLVPDVLKKQHPMAFLSGPSFAKELVEEQPTAGKKETFVICVL